MATDSGEQHLLTALRGELHGLRVGVQLSDVLTNVLKSSAEILMLEWLA